MLRITIPSTEFWDEVKQEFVYTKAQTLQLEHSLVSLSKWESRWNKPFLTKQEKTLEETIDYVKCMTLTQNVNPEVYNYLTNSNINEVNRYIALPMTALSFPLIKKGEHFWTISGKTACQFTENPPTVHRKLMVSRIFLRFVSAWAVRI